MFIFTHPVVTTSSLPASLGRSNWRPMRSAVNSMNGATVLVRALPWVEEPVRGEGLAMVLSGKVEVFANVVGKNDEDDDFTGASGILYHTHYSPLTLVSLSATCSQTQFNANIIINLKNIFLDLSHRPPRFGRLFSFRWRPFRSGYHNKNYRMNFILLSITLRWPPPWPLQLPFSVPCNFHLWGTPCLWDSLTVQHPYKIFYNLYKPSTNF